MTAEPKKKTGIHAATDYKRDGWNPADMIEGTGIYSPESPEVTHDGHINRLIQAVRKAVNIVMLSQSVLLHAGMFGILGPASQCSATCQKTNFTVTPEVTAKSVQSQTESTHTRLDPKIIRETIEKLKEMYPEVAKMPEVEQKAFVILYERDKKEIEKRMNERVNQTEAAQIQKFKTRLQIDLQNPESISYCDFFRQHESIVMGVRETEIKSGEAFLQSMADDLKGRKPTLKTLKRIAKITATPADEDKTVEQDMISVSAFKYLNTIKDPATQKVIGSCQAKAKSAIMLLEKVFPEHKDKIFYIKESGHTYAAIEISGNLYAINDGDAYMINNSQRYGTMMYSPMRSIMRFAGNDTPGVKDCDLNGGNRCLLSPKQALEGDKINIKIPHNINENKEIPSPTEDDGIGESDEEEKLLSRVESVSELYPEMAKAVREDVYEDVKEKAKKVYPNLNNHTLRKLVEEDTPFLYSESKNEHYINVGKIFTDVEQLARPDETAHGIVALIEPEQSGHLVLDFKDVEKFKAETLKIIFNAKLEVERSYIFDGMSYELLRAIGYSKINGNFKFVFKDKAVFDKSGKYLLELLELQNAPEFDITIVLGYGVVPNKRYFENIVDSLEKHPVKVTILSAESPQIDEDMKKRGEDLNEKSGPYYVSPLEENHYEVGRVLAPHLEIDYDRLNGFYGIQENIGRMMRPAVAYLTSHRVQSLIATWKDRNTNHLPIYYTAAEPGALSEFSAFSSSDSGLDIDTEMNVDDAGSLIKSFKGSYLGIYGGEHMTPELAHVLSEFKGGQLSITVKNLDYKTAHALAGFKGWRIEIHGLRSMDAETARGLANFKGYHIDLPDLTTMNVETARGLANFQGESLNLPALTTIDAKTAKVVAGYKVNSINLGVLLLDEETAKAISESKCKSLALDKIVALDINSAHALAGYDGDYLNLSGLKKPSVRVIKELAAAKVTEMSIGLTGSETPDIARALADFQGEELYIIGVPVLTTGFADELAKYNGEKISFGWEDLTINESAAEKIINFQGDKLHFRSLKMLTTDIAAELVKFRGKEIHIWETENVTPEALEVLAGFDGTIVSFLHSETDAMEIVKKADKKELTHDYRYISAKAAKVIAEYEGENLWMNDLRVLGPEVARELASAKTEVMGLNRLESLTENEARELAKYKGIIGLHGLTELNVGLATELSNFKAQGIDLDGLKSLGKNEAEILAKFNGKVLWLNGISELDEKTAGALAKFKGQLSLNGLTKLDPAAQEALAKYEGTIQGLLLSPKSAEMVLGKANGKVLNLESIHVISRSAASIVANYTGEAIWLNGLTSVTPEVIKELANYKGVLGLNGLTELEPEVATELAKAKAKTLGLNGLNEMTPEVAGIMAGLKGTNMVLKGISSMDIETARALSRSNNQIIYLGLRNSALTVEIAEEIAKFNCEYIALTNVAYLEPQVAEILAKFKGKGIYLDGLVELGAASAKKLASFHGEYLSLRGLPEMSPQVLDQLEAFKGKNVFLSLELEKRLSKRKKGH